MEPTNKVDISKSREERSGHDSKESVVELQVINVFVAMSLATGLSFFSNKININMLIQIVYFI